MKVCSRCENEKSLDSFCKCTRAKDGLQPACKQCMAVSYTASRGKKLKHYNKVSNDRRSALTVRIREWKENIGCAFCDESFGPCLELHHTNPDDKDFNPSGASNKSWKAFIKEAEKCIVVCANCHRKIHHGMIVV